MIWGYSIFNGIIKIENVVMCCVGFLSKGIFLDGEVMRRV